MPNEIESVRELLATERAALRLYEEVAEATRLTALETCRRSHEQRAVFLSGQLRRLGAELDSEPPPAALYGLGLSSIPKECLVLYAALLNAERHGVLLYDDLCPESALEESILHQMRTEQARTVKFLQATLGRARKRPRRIRIAINRRAAHV
jgi:hypothetical protein